jgi:hypothetical protein
VGAGSIYKTNYPRLYSYKMRGRRKKKQKLGKEKGMGKQLTHCMD